MWHILWHPQTLEHRCAKTLHDRLNSKPASARNHSVFRALLKYFGPMFHVKTLHFEREREAIRTFLRDQEERNARERSEKESVISTWNLTVPVRGSPVHGYLVALEEGAELRVRSNDGSWTISPQETEHPLIIDGVTFYMFTHALPTREAPYTPDAHVVAPLEANEISMKSVRYLIIQSYAPESSEVCVSPPFIYSDGCVHVL